MKETQEEEDKITSLIGNFGRWQAMLFFPLGLHFVFGSFQTLVTPFLSLEGDYFCQIEAPNGVFQSLSQWRNFSNPSANGTVDKCNIYELDYASLNKISMEEGKPAEDYATNVHSLQKIVQPSNLRPKTLNPQLSLTSVWCAAIIGKSHLLNPCTCWGFLSGPLFLALSRIKWAGRKLSLWRRC